MKGAGIVQLLYRLGKGLDDRGIMVRFPTRLRDFFQHRSVQVGSGAHPSRRVPGTCSLGVKRPGREVDYSHLPCAKELKLTPIHVLIAYCLCQHLDNRPVDLYTFTRDFYHGELILVPKVFQELL